MGVQLGSAYGKIVLDASGVGRGVQEAVGGLGGLERSALNVAGVLQGALLGAIALAASAMAAVGAMAWSAGQAFDQAFDTLQIKTGATGAELKELQEDFRKVFTSVPTDAETASEAMAILNARLDITGQELQDMTKGVLEASRMLGEDAAGNAELFARVMGDWSIPVEDGALALDKLFAAAQQSGVSMGDLMSKVVQYGAPMRQFGMTFEDAAVLFAKFEAEGVNAELVMGSLRIAAGKFAGEGKPLRESLMATFEAIKNTKDGSKALGIAMDVFGARAGADMAAAIREGRFDIEDMALALENSQGVIAATAEKTNDFGERWTILKNKVLEALEPIGTKLLELATTGIDQLTQKFEEMRPAIEEALGSIGAGGLKFLQGLITPEMTAAWDDLGQAAKDLQAAFAESMPMIKSFAEDGLGFLRQTMSSEGPGILESLTSILESITTLWQEHGDEIMAVINFAWRLIVVTIGGSLRLVFGIVAGAVAWITGIISGIFKLFEGDWRGALGSVLVGAQEAFAQIQGAAEDFFNLALSIVGTNLEEFKATWRDNWNNLVTIASAVLANVKKAISDKFAEFKAAGENLIDGLKSGAKKAWATFLSWFEGVIDLLPATVKKILGIASPSKVMAEDGRYMVQGLMKGIQTSMPGLLDMLAGYSRQMSMTLSPDLAGISAGGTGYRDERQYVYGPTYITTDGGSGSLRNLLREAR